MIDDAKISIGIRDRTKTGIRSISRGLNSLNSSVLGTTAKVGVLAGVAGIGALTISSLASADAMGKMSDRMNISTEAFAAFSLQAQLTGTSAGTVNKALEKMGKNIGDAASGLGTALPIFKDLGISIEDLKNQKGDEQYLRIAEGINKLGTSAERAAAASAIFGRSGVEMLNMISTGRDGFAAITKEVEDYGTALNRVEVAQIEKANDQLTRVGEVVKGIGMRIAVNLAPFIDAIATNFLNASKGSKGFNDTVVSTIDNIIAGIGFVQDAFRGLEAAWLGIQVVFAVGGQAIIDTIFAIAEGWRLIANLIPMVDIAPMVGFEEVVANAAERTAELKQQFSDLIELEMPSDNLVTWAEEVRVAAEAAAIQVTAVSKAAGEDETKIALGEAKKRMKIENDTTKFIGNQKKSLQSLAIGLLRQLGTENKNFALAALVVEKGLAIAQTIMNTHVASMAAMKIDLTGITSARIEAMGAVKVGLIAATGLAQAGGISGGGGGVGSPSNPVNTDSATAATDAVANAQGESRGTTNVYFQFEGFASEEMVELIVLPKLQDLITDNDVVLITQGSRQQQELIT